MLIPLLAMVAGCSDDSTTADASALGECYETRQLGDGLFPDDSCWAPPENYCSAGAGGAVTRACSADGATCCDFGTTCVPCGWSVCPQPGCPEEGGPCPDMSPNCKVADYQWGEVCEARENHATMDAFCAD